MCRFAANIYQSCCHRGAVGDFVLSSTCDSSQKCLQTVDAHGLEQVVSKAGFCPACLAKKAAGYNILPYRPRRIGKLIAQPQLDIPEDTQPELLPPASLPAASPRKASQPGTPASSPKIPWPQSKNSSTPSRTKTPQRRRKAESYGHRTAFLTPKASSPTSYHCSPGPLDHFSAMADLKTPTKQLRPQTPSSTHYHTTPRRVNKRPRTPQSPGTRSDGSPVLCKKRYMLGTEQ